MTMQAMKHIGKILGKTLPAMEDIDAAAFLEDFAVSEDNDKPITCGLFRLESGKALTYEYTYHEMKLIIDGELEISDDSGQKVTATAGDLFYFPKGSVITFSTPSFGVGFFCGQRGEGEA
jgi:ethanolamine utilization protein EutQ (cupin superfamily)